MNLLEYQAKELFRQMGIPVLPSQRIDHPKDLKWLKVPYPIVLKSQVYAGGRGKAGGVKFVENTIDAIAAAQSIFNLPIMGQYPQVLLAEARYKPDRELYLAVVIDRSSRRPLLLGSQAGGIEIESLLQKIQQVLVDQEFSPFYARRLALMMGLEGELIQTVSSIVEKMYRLFVQKDLDLVEINPLAVNPNGEVMALDGKVIVNDNALGRHSELVALQSPLSGTSQTPPAPKLPNGMMLVELEGNIGILCNGAGLAMMTADLVNKAGGKTANFLNVGSDSSHLTPPNTLPERIHTALDVLSQNRSLKVVLINILPGVVSCEQVAKAIAAHLRQRNGSRLSCVVRVVGRDFEAAREQLAALEVPVLLDLDAAIAQTITLSKSKIP
jgi:succinyl-CoA synthetase beta subunit